MKLRAINAPFDPGVVPFGATPSFVGETLFAQAGLHPIAGLDEVGRGCLAGPVVAGAVILPPDATIVDILADVRDSKMLTAAERVTLAALIKSHALAWAVGIMDVGAIDRHNILQATRLAMHDALRRLPLTPKALLLDALTLPAITLPQVPLIKGDQRSLSIAAASIIAKVARDDLMVALDAEYTGYGFAQHKGYGTPQHLAALAQLGPCALHRRTFAPVKALLSAEKLPEQLSLLGE